MLSIAFWLFVWGSVVAAANFYKTIHLSILDIFHLNYLPTCVLNRIQNIFMLQQNKICFQFIFLLSTIWIIVFILNDFSSAIQWINKMTSCFVFYFPSCDKKNLIKTPGILKKKIVYSILRWNFIFVGVKTGTPLFKPIFDLSIKSAY